MTSTPQLLLFHSKLMVILIKESWVFQKENLVTIPSAKYESLTGVIEDLPGLSKHRDVRQG